MPAERWRCRVRSSGSGLLKKLNPGKLRLQHRRIYRDRGRRSSRRCSSVRLRQVVAEAQSLRLRFSEQAGEPAQIVGEPTAWSLPIIDVSAETDPRAAAATWMQADLARPIDPVRGPLFGFALFKASATRFFWYARYHHIVLDGFGMWLIARRVAEVYSALRAGESSQGDAFGSLSALLNEDVAYRASGQLDEDRHYWRGALAARPEAGSLTFSSRPSSKPGDSCAQRLTYRVRVRSRCAHWLFAAERRSLAS